MRKALIAAAALAALGLATAAAQTPARYGLGKPATPEEIKGWDIDVRADGAGLPPGSGSVRQGEALYAQHCATCHGDKGQGNPMDRLVGGQGSLKTDRPVLTIGSFWPHATILFDYVNRAMPFASPQSLSASEVYAISAYVLFLNGVVKDDAVMDARTLPAVQMPNRDGFVADPRPDVHNPPCRSDCR